MTTIAVLPGDGIGKEITAAALRILQKLRPDLSYEHGLVGAAALDEVGEPYPEATRVLCRKSAAILFGAVGDPRYDGAPGHARPEAAILGLRKEFDLFANLRPVSLLLGLETASSLRAEVVRGIDLVVVRETTSGLYFGTPKETHRDRDGVEVAIDTLRYTAPEIERIARIAFELARKRRGHVTSVDKQNVLETGRLWRRVVQQVHHEYADVTLEHMLVDNAAMQLVRDPRRFDVVVTENTFGDILSDEAGMLTGSLGNLPSATLGLPGAGATRFGLYEPISGSAPDIAGQGIANPIAAILSGALLCRYSLDDEATAIRIERAVARAIADGARTRDIALPGEIALKTDAFADAVLAVL